jgi:radical SAM superfamily enzyme YgiQ (UPF0313 family)
MGSTAYFPPLGISTLTSFLGAGGISVEQDDLDVKTFHNNLKNNEKRIDLKIFLDEEKMKKFIKTGHDSVLESEAEKIIKLTKCKGFDVIGLSLIVTDNPSTSAVAIVIAKILKEKYDSTIIVGGPIGSSVKEKLVESGFIDYAIHGTSTTSVAEINLLNFCKMFEKGIEKQKIPGISFMEGKKIINNWIDYKKEEKFMINTPCFDGLPMELYRMKLNLTVDGKKFEKKILLLPYYFIKGCPNNCNFCMLSKEEPFWIARKPEEVVETLKIFSKKYKTNYFYFHNPTINPTYEYANELADQLIKNDVNVFWTDCANFATLDRKLIKKLKDAGAVRLVFGLELASPKIIKFVGKKLSLSHVENILRINHKLGIWSEVDMICGFPYETKNDIQNTINFLRKNKKYINGAYLNKLWLDGKLLKYPERYGIRIREDEKDLYENWSTKPFDEIHGLSWEEKIKQTESFFIKLKETIKENNFVTLGAHELFFLFSIGKLNRDIAFSTYKSFPEK